MFRQFAAQQQCNNITTTKSTNRTQILCSNQTCPTSQNIKEWEHLNNLTKHTLVETEAVRGTLTDKTVEMMRLQVCKCLTSDRYKCSKT